MRPTPSAAKKMLVSTPAWIVYSWPPVLWQADTSPLLRFVHLGTRILAAGGARSGCAGQTVWGSTATDSAAGVAWDWVEIRQGVVAMADPLGLITNLTFLDAQGEPVPTCLVAIQLNELVHALPWQDEVQRALAQH